MDIDYSTNTTSLVVNEEQERRSQIRQRNRTLILIVFSIIMSVALVTGGVIIYLVRVQYLHEQQLYVQDTAIRHFCSVSGSNYLKRYEFNDCIVLVSHSIHKTTPLMSNHPNKIFLFSLEKSYYGISNVVSTHPEVCVSSLSHTLSRVNESLGVVRVNSDLETLGYEEMKGVKVGVEMALDELGSCFNDTWKDGLEGDDEVSIKVYDVMAWMRFGNNFLLRYNRANKYFRFNLENDGESGRIVENFLQVSLFGSQYLVLVLLFWVFYRQ